MAVVKDLSKKSTIIYIWKSGDRNSELASTKCMVANSNIIAQIEEKGKKILLHLRFCFRNSSLLWSRWDANNLHSYTWTIYPNTMAMRGKDARQGRVQFLVWTKIGPLFTH